MMTVTDRRPRLDLRHLLPDRRVCTPTSGPQRETCRRAGRISAPSSAAWPIGRRLDWFTERAAWEAFQHYSGATNLLMTELTWRHGPIRVLVTDFVAMGDCLPRNAGHEKSPGQYIKRFRITNDGAELRQAMFAVYVQAEVNGGVGDPA